jgi:hypothetical protein
VTADREKLAARLRALKAKTVANGCTEAEAMAAAELLARLLDQYNMTMDEAELRSSPFDQARMEEDDSLVAPWLWVVAAAIAHLTNTRTWNERPGDRQHCTFFGLQHEVDVACYLLEICAGAMTTATLALIRRDRLFTAAKRRRAARPFLNGMSDRLAVRIRAMKPPEPVGTGLMVLHNALVDAAMPQKVKAGRGAPDLEAFAGYGDGVRAADRVALNPGLSGGQAAKLLR